VPNEKKKLKRRFSDFMTMHDSEIPDSFENWRDKANKKSKHFNDKNVKRYMKSLDEMGLTKQIDSKYRSNQNIQSN
jgi:quinol monooxygenase YgiN